MRKKIPSPEKEYQKHVVYDIMKRRKGESRRSGCNIDLVSGLSRFISTRSAPDSPIVYASDS
jgi:hypothetical protein